MKRASIITKILVFAVIVFLAWKLADMRTDIAVANAYRTEQKAQVVKFELAIDEMKRRIDNKDSDEVIAEIARAELGLGLPGEETIATK